MIILKLHMNIVQRNIMRLDHNAVEASEKISYSKSKSAMDHTVDSEAVLQAIASNLVSSTRRVSGELGIS